MDFFIHVVFFLDSAYTLSTLVYPIEVLSVETDDSCDQMSRIIIPSTGSQLGIDKIC